MQYVAVGPSCLLLASHSVRFQLAKKKQIEKKSVSFQSSAVGSTDAVPVPVVGLTASRKGQHTQTHALVYACTHAHARATHQKQQAAQQQQPLSTTLRVFFWSHSNPQNHTHTTAKPLSEQVSDTHTHTHDEDPDPLVLPLLLLTLVLFSHKHKHPEPLDAKSDDDSLASTVLGHLTPKSSKSSPPAALPLNHRQ